MVLNLLINALNQAATQSTRRHQQRLVVGLRRVTGQLVEQAGDVLTNLLIAGDDAQILVETSGRRVVVTGTDVSVTAQVVTLAAHHQRQLAVSLQTHDAVHHVHAGALQLTSPRDVGFLIKTSLNLDQRHNLLASLSRLNQRIHDGGIATGAVQGLLNRLNTRVSGSLRQERLHTGREGIVRVVQQHVVVAGGSENVCSLRSLGSIEPAGSVRNVLGVVQSRAVRANNRTHAAQIKRSRQAVHLGLVDVQLRNQQIQDGRVDGVLNLQSDRRTETTAQKLLLQSLQQVLCIVLFHLKILVTGHAEDVVLHNLHAREEGIQVLSNDVFQSNVAALAARSVGGARTIHRDHTVQLIGHLHAREQLLAGLRVTHQHRKVQRQTRNVGEGMRRVNRQRSQNRENVAHEILTQTLLSIRIQVVPTHNADVLLLQSRQHLVVEHISVTSLQLVSAFSNLFHLLLGAQTGSRRNRQTGRNATLQTRHTHHEELVQVRGHNRQEVQTLQQEQVRVLRQLQHAGVEVQPAALTVEETLRAELLFQTEVGALLALLNAVTAGLGTLNLRNIVANVNDTGHGRRLRRLRLRRLIQAIGGGYHTVLAFLIGDKS